MQIVSKGKKMRGIGIGFDTPMTAEGLCEIVPAIDCRDAAPTTSSRYAHISTRDVIGGLEVEGWQVVGAGTALTRDPARRRFAQHLIRLRHPDMAKGSDGIPELLLRNSHSGVSTWEGMGGYFRIICSNGLVAADGAIAALRVRHTATAVRGVVEAAAEIAGAMPQVVARIDDWRGRYLPPEARTEFSERALALRWQSDAPLDAAALLTARRNEDQGDDVWHVLNRIQENLLKGCEPSPGWPRPTSAAGKLRAVRAVRGIEPSLVVNRGLWALAEQYASA